MGGHSHTLCPLKTQGAGSEDKVDQSFSGGVAVLCCKSGEPRGCHSDTVDWPHACSWTVGGIRPPEKPLSPCEAPVRPPGRGHSLVPVSMCCRLLLLRLSSFRSLDIRNCRGFSCPMLFPDRSIFTMSDGSPDGTWFKSVGKQKNRWDGQT